MIESMQYFIRYFCQLFLVICPLAIVAMFVSMTAPFSPAERIHTAKVGSAVAYGTMLFFAITGRKIFEILGITMGSFYVAGGVVIFLIGILMLRSNDDDSENTNSDEQSSTDKTKSSKKSTADISITPFGIPIICGPACITSIIALQSQAVGLFQQLLGFLALTAVLGLLYLLLIGSAHGAKWLSPIVLKLSYKLSGLILAALAVQMMVSGLRHPDLKVLQPLKQQSVVVKQNPSK